MTMPATTIPESLTGIPIVDRMAAALPAVEYRALAQAIQHGFLVLRAEQHELQRIWILWCIKSLRPDIRVELGDGAATVTMRLATSQTTLSGDGMFAIKHAFQRYGTEAQGHQTRTWCMHPHVPLYASTALATHLVEIAYLDGVPQAA